MVVSKLPTWWCDDFDLEKVKVSKLFKKACKSKQNDDWQKYKDAKKAFKSKIQKSKRSSWIKYCSEIESPEQISKLKKIIERKDNRKIGLLKYSSGDFCKSPEEVSKLLLD